MLRFFLLRVIKDFVANYSMTQKHPAIYTILIRCVTTIFFSVTRFLEQITFYFHPSLQVAAAY